MPERTGYEGRSLTNLEMLERRLRTEGRVYTHMEAAAEIKKLRGLLTAWLYSGGTVCADLDKLRADTEEALS